MRTGPGVKGEVYYGVCYGCVTSGENPLTKKRVSDKVASQDDEEQSRPSTDTGTASHGMCSGNAEGLCILKKMFCFIRVAMRYL